jgi:hypothetical protein
MDPDAKLILVWNLYLDDSPSTAGELDLLSEIRERRYRSISSPPPSNPP